MFTIRTKGANVPGSTQYTLHPLVFDEKPDVAKKFLDVFPLKFFPDELEMIWFLEDNGLMEEDAITMDEYEEVQAKLREEEDRRLAEQARVKLVALRTKRFIQLLEDLHKAGKKGRGLIPAHRARSSRCRLCAKHHVPANLYIFDVELLRGVSASADLVADYLANAALCIKGESCYQKIGKLIQSAIEDANLPGRFESGLPGHSTENISRPLAG